MNPASGDARKTARLAMSSGSPSRCTGTRLTNPSRRRAGIERTSGVPISPGRMAFAVTPRGPNSCASACVKAMTPALLAA